MFPHSKLSWGLALGLLAASNVNAAPSIKFGMEAAFSAGPYLLELLEAAASENSTSYFPLLDSIANGAFLSAPTDQALYETFLRVLREDGHLASPEELSTFKLALSTRSTAPRIEAHYQYYDTAVEPQLQSSFQERCEQWVALGGVQYCSASLDEDQPWNADSSPSLPFDRVLGSGPSATLYADPASPSFAAFHNVLASRARNGEISYRLRYRRARGVAQEPLPISGYGVELALKRTDYIVIDDRESSSSEAQKPVDSEMMLDQAEEVADLKPLSTSELASLGLKAASFIMQNQSPFDTLIKLTQDFPKFSSSVSKHEISEEFNNEHKQNRMTMVPSGVNVLWMNGVQLIERQIEAFTLVDMLRRERKLINGVRALGLTGKQAVSLLGHRKIASAKSDDEPPRFDWRDDLEEGRVIMWLNNLEDDDQYKEFPTKLTSLLQRTFPGQLPPIRRNIFHVVVPVDLTKPEDIGTIANLYSFVKRKLPVRFGLVPLASIPEKEDQIKMAYHLFETYGVEALTTYLQTSSADGTLSGIDQSLFDKVITEMQAKLEASPSSLEEAIQSEDMNSKVLLARHWVKRLNADTVKPPIFVNGLPLSRTKSWLQAMSMQVTRDLQSIQQGVYTGVIDEDEWVAGRFLIEAFPRRNQYIYPEDGKSPQILDVNKVYNDHANLFSKIPVVEASAQALREAWATLTVIADLATESGRELLLSALEFRRESPGIRLDIVHNPEAEGSGTQFNRALKVHQDALLETDTTEGLQRILEAADVGEDDSYPAALTSFLSGTSIVSGSNVLMLNGRMVGPFQEEVPFEKNDFQQLLDFELTSRILPVYEALEDLDLVEQVSDPLVAAKLTSSTALSTISDLPEGIFESAPTTRVAAFDEWSSNYTAIEVGDPESASIHLVGLINPVSEQGQRWAPILKVLSEIDGVYLKLFLNPLDTINELPVKRFYRYVLESEPRFDDAGKVRALKATFKGLPSEALLTAGMNIPPSWLVAAKSSVHDLDNIKLSSVRGDVEAMYELENILIEGHSREGRGGQAPRGAQLVLGTQKDAHFADTIIMANLGYFQFKANPGFYNIQLKEGKSADIYSIESVGAKGWAPVAGDDGTEVILMDFQGTTLFPRLRRKPGQEQADVLEESEPHDHGIIAQGLKVAGNLFGTSTKSVSAQKHAEINVFSVASGHLYERMLNIMMLSVMKNTKHTVKFWFIEQFLSPSFKDFIPHMAAAYGFKYEMVTFKWPHWLRQQKEKQREIWGYKILFLDVLFPLSLDKVIFVDADQIVRTDLIDLVNHDLEGKPYGFTPMCDSRTEMEGFRFWKQGYWANYLKGHPYHISALYVVDLRRFRELAAGDRLRQSYHTLSQDPNSLSNLDQDLPNHMQFTIPIHSLPQEWLWCETWCSDESRSQARTIDLCNNPQTKEPKLDRARRQVPEWTAYDDEIAALAHKRKELLSEGDEASNQEEHVLQEEGFQKNPKSRNWEEPPEAKSTHKKDEL